MLSLTRIGILSLLVALAGEALSSSAQTAAKSVSKRGSVAGRVTLKGKPAPGIVVGMRLSDAESPSDGSFKATTDTDGNYRIVAVPPGSYQIAPRAGAYVVLDTDNRVGRNLVVSEGDAIDGIDFALVRGGVITGKITDADGRPIIEHRVNLILGELPPNQSGAYYAFTGVETDDRGVYRIFGLKPGKYRVSAGTGQENRFNRSAGRSLYRQVFYPDATDASKATVIELSEGSEASNIDIRLGPAAQTFTVSGRAIDGETGQPLAGARFGLQITVDGSNRYSWSGLATSNSQGEFTLENLQPGRYEVFVVPSPGSNIRSESVPFEVTNEAVKGLVVKTLKGATVNGVVTIENTTDKAVFARLAKLYIYGGTGDRPGYAHWSPISADGSFSLTGLEEGQLTISLGGSDMASMKGFSIARLELDGVEQSAIKVNNGERIQGVRVVLVYGNAILRGVVKWADGEMPRDARTNVSLTRAGETRACASTALDARGHFLVEGLPGGLYSVQLHVYIPGSPGRPHPPVTQQVNIADSGVTEVTITVEPTTP